MKWIKFIISSLYMIKNKYSMFVHYFLSHNLFKVLQPTSHQLFGVFCLLFFINHPFCFLFWLMIPLFFHSLSHFFGHSPRSLDLQRFVEFLHYEQRYLFEQDSVFLPLLLGRFGLLLQSSNNLLENLLLLFEGFC